MSIWKRLGDFVSRVSGSAYAGLMEAVRTLFEGDPVLRRRVAFSIAMIALSAKMAKADGIVTQDEVRAFQQIFSVPTEHARDVARLYDLAKGDTAGFETYARHMANLFEEQEDGRDVLEDILDGLFFIAKADGFVHEREIGFLRRTAEIFSFDELRFDAILARHASGGESDPYKVLGVFPTTAFDEIRRRYRALVAQNHPDRLMARGLPEEFLIIANQRVAALNVAYETIERGRRRS
ncbi:MAG: DnaJ family molecular chaperone [Mesorhizobium sp.]|nr:DnaJ family molecular chaperone [Mesorhizobium sp.]